MADEYTESYETTSPYVRRPIIKETNVTVEKESNAQYLDTKRRKRTTTIIIIVIVVIIVLILVGLLIWWLVARGHSSNTPTGTALGGSCHTDRDCQVGLICSALVCTSPPNGSCTKDADCPVNYSCTSGSCLGNPGAVCTSTTECQSGLLCTNNLCV